MSNGIGAGGIRTPGAFRHNGFQDRRLKPLGHCSMWNRRRMERREVRAYLRQIHRYFTPDRWMLQGDRDEFPEGVSAWWRWEERRKRRWRTSLAIICPARGP